jgi:hypothetical protein
MDVTVKRKIPTVTGRFDKLLPSLGKEGMTETRDYCSAKPNRPKSEVIL